jgi:hypothetical protein
MLSKYGDMSNPYELTMRMPNNEGGENGTWGEGADASTYSYNY